MEYMLSEVSPRFPGPGVRLRRTRDVGLAGRVVGFLMASVGLWADSTNLITNGDFSPGLEGWTFSGAVSASSGLALTRDGSHHSVLFQAVANPGLPLTLSLEFYLGGISASVPSGTFPDAAFFSIYESKTPSGLRPDLDLFDSAAPILDVSAGGFANLAASVSVSPSSRGADWWTVRLTDYVPTHAYVAPTLELYNLNGIANDSVVPMTTVSILSVPEPRPLALLGVAAVVGAVFRRRYLGVFLGLCLTFFHGASELFGQQVGELGSRVRLTTSNERSEFDRTTRLITSTADVTLTNVGDRPIRGPLRVRVSLAGDGDLGRVTVVETTPGTDQDPGPFRDLTALLPATGLAPGGVLAFRLRIVRPNTVQVSYRLEAQGVVNLDPVVLFEAPLVAVAGEEITFDASASDDGEGGKTLRYAWNFGDGGSASIAAPRHTFTAPGRYDVNLTVTDPENAIGILRKTVTVVPAAPFAVARTRTLDETGQPLGDVVVLQRLGDGVIEHRSDLTTGFVALGGEPGEYLWRFSRDGYLPAWRKASLAARQVALIPGPWLALQETPRQPVSPLRDLRLGSASRPAAVVFPAGALTVEGMAGFTSIGPQSLPLPLPPGWSPLGTFHLALPAQPSQPGVATWNPLDRPIPGDTLAMLKYDASLLQWTVVSKPPVAANPTGPVDDSGTFALVVADRGARAPSTPVVGAALPGAIDVVLDVSEVTASASVDPARLTASLDPVAMTATGRVVFSAPREMSSGAWFRTEIEERYRLTTGTTQRSPLHDTVFFAYQRPGDSDAKTLHAAFPLRPSRLLAPDQVDVAQVKVDILTGDSFAASLFDTSGGRIASAGITVSASAADLLDRSIVELRTLDTAGFDSLISGAKAEAAFQLSVGNVAPGRSLGVVLTGVAPDRDFVLARHVILGAVEGLEPVERLRSDAQGEARSVEPTDGLRLSGVLGSGQYVVVSVDAPQVVLRGIAQDVAGFPTAGLAVRVQGRPWLTFSAANGSFRLVAQRNLDSMVTVTDPRDANTGSRRVSAVSETDPAPFEVRATTTAPRVVATVPGDGAQRVRAATPVTVTFSEPIDAGSFGPEAITLTHPSGVVVQGALLLNPAGTEATFLPTQPLEPAATYTIALKETIRDRQGLALDGARTFKFSVVPLSVRDEGAQLVIYEPGADRIPNAVRDRLVGYNAADGSSHVVVHGSAGSADPGVPVILVNQNKGATATVVSQVDGSFASFINASEEDFIEAVFVNANGTRITVPVTRQIYDSGRIGLYKYGGILEAQSDGGPVQVLVEPGAIAQRSVFQVDAVGLAEVLALVKDTQPEGGRILGGIRIRVEGDPLQEPPDVAFPVRESDLGLPAGVSPDQGVYALVQQDLGDSGEILYSQVDKMEFESGRLLTKSPPYPGITSGALGNLLYLPVRIAFGAKLTVVGRVVAVSENDPAPAEEQILAGQAPVSPIAGAVVSAFPGDGPRLRPGAIVARANSSGFYALTVPYNPLEPSPISIQAQTARFPGIKARRVTALNTRDLQPGVIPVLTINPVFTLPASVSTADTLAPLVTVRSSNSVFPVGVDHEVVFVGSDDSAPPKFVSLQIDLGQSIPLVAGETLVAGDVTLRQVSAAAFGNSTEETVSIFSRKAALVAVSVVAQDPAGNRREAVFKFRMGPPVLPAGMILHPMRRTIDSDPPSLAPRQPETSWCSRTVWWFFSVSGSSVPPLRQKG